MRWRLMHDVGRTEARSPGFNIYADALPFGPASKRGQRRTETGERRSPDRSRLLGWRVLRAGTRSCRTRPGCRPRSLGTKAGHRPDSALYVSAL